MLHDFDTKYKVNPPLRTQQDIDALLEGLSNGTIDYITSDHNPLTIEDKNVEFEHASNGTIGLESAFGALNTLFSTEIAIKLLTRGKKHYQIESFSIEVGEKANLTLFNPDEDYLFDKSCVFSKSKNSIFLDHDLTGRAYGVIANNQIILRK